MHEIVITAVGPDRPGLVGKLTAPLLEMGANLADSRMVNLRGQFAILMLAEVPERAWSELEGRLHDVAVGLGLVLSLRMADRGPTAGRPTVGVPYRLHAYAMDQPGIVHRITERLEAHGVNVEELETRAQPRPESGAPLFSMELRMTVPATVPVKALRRELEQLCDALNCDVEIQPDGR